ncbi:MAG: type II/IV secretion system ATPase subunit [Euryarchaeota archaeon]|nr:type II/IV secretion system ATPase subunit [Euryarchaeota archaeon]
MARPSPPGVRSIRRALGVLGGSTVESGEYNPKNGPLTEFGGLPGCEERERYWVDPPFAFVSINHDPVGNEHRYHVVTPELDGFERRLLELLTEGIRTPLIHREDAGDDPDAVLREELTDQLETYGVEIGTRSFHRLFYYLRRAFRGYGKIDPLICDPHVEDISCDGYDIPLFVYHDEYTDIETNIVFSEAELDSFVVRLAQQSGRHVSVGDPVTETTLPDGSRAELALGREVTPRGSAYTIRKYAEEPMTPIDLIRYGTVSAEQMAYLWLAIEHNKSLLFAGGTASGKTTAMNAVSMFIPPRAKVLTIEDTRELTLQHENWLSSITREGARDGASITMYDLLRSALRHRPEYIIVGEVRGEEAITLFQAMNTGHTTYSTMHADSVQTVINRLENEPINVPRAMIQSLDVLCIQTLTRVGDERVRRTETIAEIDGIDGRTGELDYSRAYRWRPETDSFERNDGRVTDSIRKAEGWSQSELRSELDRRKEFLETLSANEITDFRRFSGLVNAYYADPETARERIGERG